MRRKMLIMGHYGAGKTEVSVNMALKLKETIDNLAMADVDIANPYFRSREIQQRLEDAGVKIYFNEYGFDITEDLPAVTARIRAPLEDPECTTIIDVGGNDSGARVVRQFDKYFHDDETDLFYVVNGNRFETDTVEGLMFHLNAIETETELAFTGIINNTHMLSETTVDDIIKGYKLCKELQKQRDIPIVFSTCNEKLLDELNERIAADSELKDMVVYPIVLQMRPSWLDVKF